MAMRDELDDLQDELREAEVYDGRLRGDLVTAQARVGFIKRAIADHESTMSALKRRISERRGG